MSQCIPSFKTYSSKISLFLICISSLIAPAHAQANLDAQQNFPQVDIMSPLGVDMQTGNFVQSGTDLQIGPLTVDHYVRSRYRGLNAKPRAPSQFATNLHGSAYIDDNTTFINGNIAPNINAIVQIGSLRLSFHVSTSNGSFFPIDSSNTGWKMIAVGTQWLLTNKSGEEYRFDRHLSSSVSLHQYRRLTSRKSADGHMLNYSYDSNARLTQVISNRGYMVKFEYIGNNVRVCGYNMATASSSALANCSAAELKVTYGRDTLGRLNSITQLDGSVINITYEGSRILPKCITLPNSPVCRIKNTHFTPIPGQLVSGNARLDHVIRQESAEGEVFNYEHQAVDSFTEDSQPHPDEIQKSYSWIKPQNVSGTDNLSITSFEFGNGSLQKVSGATGDAQYQYSSNAIFRVSSSGGPTVNRYYSIYPHRVIYPDGNQTTFVRDWADNVITRTDIPKSGSGESNQVTQWTYPVSNLYSVPSICNAANVLCDKATKIVDPKGNESNYTYSAVHGGVLTATGPADTNGVRPQTRYIYGQRNARDANGNALQPPIWVLLSEESCIKSAAVGTGCAAGSADEVMTSYDYGPTSGPNNLLLRGTAVTNAGKTLRTCYTYDNLGRRISETQPKGVGGTCP